jgi:murein peptide amidase A
MQRLLINVGGYKGEGILIDKVLRDIDEEAKRHFWEAIPMRLNHGTTLPAFQKLAAKARKNVYISTGIHGDEPAGPLAALELLKENPWPSDLNIWLVACLNPKGFTLNRRENEDGIDLNRDFRSPKTEAVRAHTQWLSERPRFDVTLLLHEDWESNGFYLYELNLDLKPSVGEAVVRAVKEVCPIDMSPVIEGREAKGGIICANREVLKRPDWPEALYLVHRKTSLSYTLEAPSDFPLRTRIQALTVAVKAALNVL